MQKKAAVIGLGLIGGSIALAIKQEHPGVYITGTDVDEAQTKLAVSLSVIDEAAPDLENAVKEADLVVLATPVATTEKLLVQLAGMPLKPGAIVTDVGSTKTSICEQADVLSEKNVHFIGGHPMAGSHKSGVHAARVRLFENAYYVLVPNGPGSSEKIGEIKDWLQGTQAKFIELSYEQHDLLTGVISHFPHIVASALVHQVKGMEDEQAWVTKLAAGGFRDITRIASASPEMWTDILLKNNDVMRQLMEDWKQQMSAIEQMLAAGDKEQIYQFFEHAKSYRDGLPAKKQGAIPAIYDLFVDVPDHPGVISDVTGILGRTGISIINIRILETREDIMGVLQLTFRTEDDRRAGMQQLEKHDYESYIG
ncbi:prephenate dehydrogenase [uncultured Marinococcus sp.]|uniref:prephenate dehydrogenase n=1 Tax=uncultured Marinococcus sp. TaxID=487012 RepID=UPI0026364CD0|nr:prephenate dehydrogenase [uncultured Marinococcus sp.]